HFYLYFQAYLDCSSEDCSNLSDQEQQRAAYENVNSSSIELGVDILKGETKIFAVKQGHLNPSRNSESQWTHDLYAYKRSAIRYEDIETSRLSRDRQIDISSSSTYKIQVSVRAIKDPYQKTYIQPVMKGGAVWPL
ncbi:MAG: hypothetical protein AAGH78_10770, partial [Cyanobacteria bacterium P01_H01_bin.58]